MGISNLSQTTIRLDGLEPPEGFEKWNGKVARESLSKFARSNALGADCIFHHLKGGALNQGYPLVRFGGGRNGWGVTLLPGITQIELTDITMALARYAVEYEALYSSKNLNVSAVPAMTRYNASTVLGKAFKKGKIRDGVAVSPDRSPNDYNMKLVNDVEFREAELKWSITKGLIAQVKHYLNEGLVSLRDAANLFNCRSDIFTSNKLRQSDFEDFMDLIEIDKSESLSPEKRSTWMPRFYLEFSLPIELSGNWAFGRMTHKGFGRIYKVKGGV